MPGLTRTGPRTGARISVPQIHRYSSSSSSTRWKSRQSSDKYAREAKLQGLRSRAAFKLIEIADKYKIFKRGQTVVDLGYAPGSWTQVALDRTRPGGRVLGIDLLPAQPPDGAIAIRGDFLSPKVQAEMKRLLRGVYRRDCSPESAGPSMGPVSAIKRAPDSTETTEGEIPKLEAADTEDARPVDIVLSDLMMNTSGIAFRDHTSSMDLCNAALAFAAETLRPNGHFICKFYQGSEDGQLERRIKALFGKVYREKPDSSRKESRECYFVGIRRRGSPD